MKTMRSNIVYIFLMLCTISHTIIMDARGGGGGRHGGGGHRGGHRGGGHRGGGHHGSGHRGGHHGGYGRGGYGYGGYGYGGWGTGAAILGTTAVVGAAAASSSNNSNKSYEDGYRASQEEIMEDEKARLEQENAALRQQIRDK